MLDDGGDGADGQRVFAGERHGHFFLIADAEIAAAHGNQRGSRALGGLDDLHVQAFFLIPALGKRHIHAGVVGVGHVIENHGHVRKLFLGKGKGGAGQQQHQQADKQFLHKQIHPFALRKNGRKIY